MQKIDLPSQKLSSQSGFTLIELLIAVAIAAAVCYGAAHSVLGSHGSQVEEELRVRGISIAESLMEDLLMRPASDSLIAEGTHQRLYDKQGAIVLTGGRFTGEWTVQRNSPLLGLATIQLRVFWDGPTKARRSVRLETTRNL